MRTTELRGYSHAVIHTGVLWDITGSAGILPSWWPPVSWVLLAAGITAGCAAVLLDVLGARRGGRAAAGGGRLLALGLILGAWVLRGDAEIVPELPLVAAELLGAALYATLALRRPG